jgi:hypothetical protein
VKQGVDWAGGTFIQVLTIQDWHLLSETSLLWFTMLASQYRGGPAHSTTFGFVTFFEGCPMMLKTDMPGNACMYFMVSIPTALLVATSACIIQPGP